MESIMEKENKEKIKACTVGHLWRWNRSPLRRPSGKDVPTIKLTGVWLEKIGFEIGKKYIVKASHSQITLLLKEWCDNASESTTDEADYAIKASHSQVLQFLKGWSDNASKSPTKKRR
jgi:hypothetical protein